MVEGPLGFLRLWKTADHQESQIWSSASFQDLFSARIQGWRIVDLKFGALQASRIKLPRES